VRAFLALSFALVIAVASIEPSTAVASSSACSNGPYGGTIDCGGSFGTTEGGGNTSAPSSKSSSNGADPDAEPATEIAILSTTTGGAVCLTYTTDLAAVTPAERAYIEVTIHNLGVDYPACPPAAPGAAAPPPPNPAVVAQDFWNTTPLPVPQPTIPPGWAITGKPAYLVTGGTLAPPTYTYATPLGTLTITAHGSYTVNWGDGTTNGPFDTEGLPYPNGNIAHTYDNVGTVTVTLNEAWTATWTIGGNDGTLNQLQTQATIANFQIRQIQAVITG
jgi:hypothetical protein